MGLQPRSDRGHRARAPCPTDDERRMMPSTLPVRSSPGVIPEGLRIRQASALDVGSEAQRIGGDLQVNAFGYEDVNVAVATLGSGLMWANMLRPFQLGKARTSHRGPWSWIRESRVASFQESCPACHFTNASASAVMKRSSSRPGTSCKSRSRGARSAASTARGTGSP